MRFTEPRGQQNGTSSSARVAWGYDRWGLREARAQTAVASPAVIVEPPDPHRVRVGGCDGRRKPPGVQRPSVDHGPRRQYHRFMDTLREALILTDLPGLTTATPRDLSTLDLLTHGAGYHYRGYEVAGLVMMLASIGLALAMFLVMPALVLFPAMFLLFGAPMWWFGRSNRLASVTLLEKGLAVRGSLERAVPGGLGRSRRAPGARVRYADPEAITQRFWTTVPNVKHLCAGMEVAVLLHPSNRKIVGAVMRGKRDHSYGLWLADGAPEAIEEPAGVDR